MPRTWNRGRLGLEASLILILAGCPGSGGSRNNTAQGTAATAGPKSASPGIELRIEKKTDPFAPWQIGQASVVIENKGEHPVVILKATLATSDGTAIASASTVARFPSAVTVDRLSGAFADVMTIEGILLEDQPGAAARLPSPPRWEWKGDGELATFSLLLPGRTRRWAGTFRARYDVGDELRARVRFTVIGEAGFAYYRKGREEAENLAGDQSPMASRGMTEVLRVKVPYAKQTGIPTGAGEATPPSTPMALPFTPFAYALPAQAFDALEVDEAEAAEPLGIARFPFDIDAARAAAGVAAGPYTRALAAEVWVLFADGATHLASAGRLVKVQGNAIPLADALNDNRKHSITLYRGARKPDEAGHIAHLRDKGLRVSENQEKDGSYTGMLRVGAKQIVETLQALDARGLRMKGDDEVE